MKRVDRVRLRAYEVKAYVDATTYLYSTVRDVVRFMTGECDCGVGTSCICTVTVPDTSFGMVVRASPTALDRRTVIMAKTKKEQILDRFGVTNSIAQQHRDIVRVALAFFDWRTCGLCERPTVKGYICFHCKEDDGVHEE